MNVKSKSVLGIVGFEMASYLHFFAVGSYCLATNVIDASAERFE